jgi:hypothetical protein
MNIKVVKPSSTSEKLTRTTVDTIEFTHKLVASWRLPSFQRELKINAKVIACAKEITEAGGVLPGILTIGMFEGDAYIVDGQHRLSAWSQTGLQLGYADVRTCWFNDMSKMADEYVRLNSSLVKLRPDDVLRGHEASTPALSAIRHKCKFIGYDMIRRGDKSPVLSMSVFVRIWAASRQETPTAPTSENAIKLFDDEETRHAITFALICYEAWSRDREYSRLWGALNLSLCAWLYRRLVLGQDRTSETRAHKFSADEFRKCLMSLSAESAYLDYLVGRNTTDRDRAPAYARVRQLFQKRIFTDTGRKIRMPEPPWSHT